MIFTKVELTNIIAKHDNVRILYNNGRQNEVMAFIEDIMQAVHDKYNNPELDLEPEYSERFWQLQQLAGSILQLQPIQWNKYENQAS